MPSIQGATLEITDVNPNSESSQISYSKNWQEIKSSNLNDISSFRVFEITGVIPNSESS